MEACIFCKIVQGESPVSQFYEDDLVLGLMTIGPVNDGHAMVIPKAHVALLSKLEEEVGRHLFTVTQRTAAAIRASGLRCEGVNLFLADGEAAFQEVKHLHMHVFPRFASDAFQLVADWSYIPARESLDASARAIETAYRRLFGNTSILNSNKEHLGRR